MQRTPLFAAALGITVITASAFFGCDDDTASVPIDYAPLLRTLTENVVLPAQTAFAARAEDLVSAAGALDASPDATALAKAQTAWRAARAAYRALDATHFGPIADLGISERIDVSPGVPSDIEAIVSASTPIDAQVVANAGGKAKGFLGVEYLLFSADGDAASLARLQGDGAATRRRDLAKAMADEIASSAHQLSDAWDASKGGYANEVENAGTTSKRYPSQRAAVDDFVGGVGYALEIVVGIRLALPLGKKNGGAPDPTADPTRLSDSAVADMNASLSGVQAIYGADGFSSRVRARSGALDGRAVSELGDCGAKVSAIPAPFATSVSNDTTSVDSAYDACKALKSTWNTEITSALGATLKPGDNDGD